MSIIASSILSFSLLTSPVASEDLSEPVKDSVEGPEITLSDDSFLTAEGLSVRASSGKGHLEGNNPLGLKPRAIASTIVNSGTAVTVKAKIDSNNNGTSTSTSGWHTLSNTNKVSTPKLVALTEKTTFFGYHQIKKYKSSDWETAQTQVSF
ncbi:hypothetical protein ACQKNC_20620 [Lysinibacillus sp. NPDC094177]|uniref:hypothetical protein n=1 Tax=Lysinibacillus sp. NPDC094177 TaxID=3390580 RepID=UPI003D053A9C